MNKKFDVTVVGNVGIDTNVYFSDGHIHLDVESNFTENIDYIGQAGGYSARGYAQLGYHCSFIGAVGNDYSGHYIRKTFESDNIDTSGIFIDSTGTSRSINLMDGQGRRKNFYDGKNHMNISPQLDLCEQIFKKSKLAHFHIPNWARELLPMAKKYGVKIGCDIQDVVDLNDPYRKEFIEFADVLFLSLVNHDDPMPFIDQLLKEDESKIIVVGMGARGCALGSRALIKRFDPMDLNKPIIDTNGAGDGLAVGFLSSYFLEGLSIEDSIRRGQICARYTCAEKATSDFLISKKQLESYFG